ncbi:hypothetical protein M8756_16490 [Lutimaribacter sp. EGI FJ00015]|uniref:Uncharacterized protein n=1 Tax=Lutimaribacter degradans TaxID=2945989 RepID=A0ACC6A2B9_9RHOB|nr:hypothetical protein [Lutimaribacter sp. EGI FJ00013]MCM2563729.1 hypothetical protein [Lutimaribacter sp. EGI FJ00013]MCO0614913.1 hypothetical protein [Lutimaribacter sp. EGI FJ00015]MCO0637605.1 hypothetical protein [Lutimaribacter sp. EGI FJ00014]
MKLIMNMATRKFGCPVRLPEAGVPAEASCDLSKSAVSRRFKVLRRTFGADTRNQRCQARNINSCLAPAYHAAVRRALKQAWAIDDAEKAKRLIRNLARRFDWEATNVAGSILAGLGEILPWSGLGCRLSSGAHWPAPIMSRQRAVSPDRFAGT